MATWYIGIDETGSFNHLDLADKSFVCAVVTQMSHGKILDVFKNICSEFRLCRIEGSIPESEIMKKFHGCKQGDNRERILKKLLEKKDELFPRVVVCQGKPSVTVNPQQWWMSSIMGAIEGLFSDKNKEKPCLFKPGDNIEFSIANRDAKCLGLLGGYLSKSNWNDYNKTLKSNIQEELTKTYPRYKISVDICSAEYKAIPALADQVTNMVKLNMYKNFVLVKPKNLSLGNGRDVDAYIENENWLGAAEILLSNIFNGEYTDVNKLGSILKNADATVSAFVLKSVETALSNRGEDGNAINHVGKIMPILRDNREKIKDPSLLVRFFNAYGSYVGNAGLAEDEYFSEIKKFWSNQSLTFKSRYDKWKFYVEMMVGQSDVRYNAYDFDIPGLEHLNDVQERINDVEFPPDVSKNREDEIISKIQGMLGQQAAFLGQSDEAIGYFNTDYNNSTDDYYKAMAASFLTVVYHREENLEDAKRWLEEEDRLKGNKNDQWLILDKLRVGALALEKGKKWEDESMVENIQSWHNEGDYPWPLLLKWKAYIEYKKKNVEIAQRNLSQASKKLRESSGFTIRTLALSVLAMLIVINKETANNEAMENHQNEYVQLLNKCCNEVQTFKNYVNSHPEFNKAKTGDISLWEAATLLPFNYS